MTDEEIARWNELARARREAALGEHDPPPRPEEEREIHRDYARLKERIAAKYPLKQRVSVETAPVRVRTFDAPCEIAYRITEGVVFYERVGEGWQQWLTVENARIKWRDDISRHEDDIRQIKMLLAMCDSADTIEDVTTWSE